MKLLILSKKNQITTVHNLNLNVDSIIHGLTSGYPAHRAHSGEESERRGRAETSGHREPRPHHHGYGLLGHRH